MKLISIKTLAIAANTTAAEWLALSNPTLEPEVQAFAEDMAATMQHNPTLPMVEDYCFYSGGNVLSDDGLIPMQSETLSLGDDHAIEDDLEYIADEAATHGWEFVTVTHYRNGVLVILYFVK